MLEKVTFLQEKFEYSVTEISLILKRFVESNFRLVKVRGEISGLKIATSGHIYFSLKDSQSNLSAVCWKGITKKLSVKIEEGMEILCVGTITTFSSQSKYQLVVEQIELAGIGSLMALLEKRKQQFKAEGIFDQARKKPLPFLPKNIAIITSLSGAVIKDILHRIRDRCPTNIIIWPVLVQGDQAAKQVEIAINGFNKIDQDELKPDVIIIARGGGSIEDLWAFNEEIVIRAVANSIIPIISAIGHETDVTLIDFVSDLRAPTPTAAAEFVVPVKYEIELKILEKMKALNYYFNHNLIEKNNYIINLTKNIISPNISIVNFSQRIDILNIRMQSYLQKKIVKISNRLELAINNFSNLSNKFSIINLDLQNKLDKIKNNYLNQLKNKRHKLEKITSHLNIKSVQSMINIKSEIINNIEYNLKLYCENFGKDYIYNLHFLGNLIESYNYQKTLERGYTIIMDINNNIINKKTDFEKEENLKIMFKDGVASFSKNNV